MYLRARQEPEVAILDRRGAGNSQYLPSKPPVGPRDEVIVIII